jgi:hypothetical protein
VSSGQAGTQRKEGPLLSLLPDQSELKGWIEDGDHQFFEGDDLFIYIDGGAEIYFEYGFARVIVQDYKNAAGSRLSLEIFEMNSPESAYGMFTFKGSQRGEAVDLGDECQLADYYLNLWKSRYLITITGLDQESTPRDGLIALAGLVESKIFEQASRPSLVSLLPEEGLKPQSLKFLKGPLALFNSYPFFREDVFAFRSGIKAEYGNDCTLFLFEYGAHEQAGGRFSEARRKFSAEPKYRNVESDGERIKAQDERGRTILARVSGRYIVLVLGESPQQKAETLLAQAEKSLAAQKEEP